VADRVARSLGIELDAPQRLRAGVLFVLTEAAGNGNVFLPLPELWQAAAWGRPETMRAIPHRPAPA
jgi:exodeoxyribonuclease V alpha subunit